MVFWRPRRGTTVLTSRAGASTKVVSFVRIELDRAELNAAWRAADLPNLPPTLTGGRSADTPIDASLARLRDQGLIGSDGAVAADLRDALDDFAHAPFEIDVRIGPDRGTEIRAVVTVRRNAAVLAVRNGDQVTLRRLPAKVA